MKTYAFNPMLSMVLLNNSAVETTLYAVPPVIHRRMMPSAISTKNMAKMPRVSVGERSIAWNG